MRPSNDDHARLGAALARLSVGIDWERRDSRVGMDVTTDAVRDLCARLGEPQRRFRAVHIAGTKGKGSIGALVEAGLSRLGKRSGRFSSPHVERINERITIAGQEVADADFADGLEAALAARDAALAEGSPGAAATRFDLETVAAFAVLAAKDVEWAVIECGLGGRRDSTNVLAAPVVVLTNVGLEHTEVLGSTEAAIAGEKVAILQPGGVLVTGVPRGSEAGIVVEAHAAALGCPVDFVVPAPDVGLGEINRAIAAAALDAVGRQAGEPQLSGVVLGTLAAPALPGRTERRAVPRAVLTTGEVGEGGVVSVVLDAAHVAFSLAAVLRDLDRDPTLAGPCVAIVGFGRDKDARAMLGLLAARADTIVCTESDRGPPAFTAGELAELGRALGADTIAATSPRDALACAGVRVASDGWLLVIGSFHLIGAVRPLLGGSKAIGPIAPG